MATGDHTREIEIHHTQRLGLLSKILAATVTLLGLLGLLAHAGGGPAIASLWPGGVAMAPATAACLLLGGTALALGREGANPRQAWLGAALAGVVLALAGTVLVALALGAEATLQALHAAPSPGAGGGRVASASAFGFLLAGGSVLLLGRSTRGGLVPSQLLVLPVLVVALLGTLSYLYQAVGPRGAAPFHAMSLPTALGLLALATGVLLARPQAGWMAGFTRSGATGMMLRRLVPAILLVPVLVGWLRLQGEQLGWYGTGFGLALMVTTTLGILLVLVRWTAHALHVREQARRQAEAERAEAERSRSLILESAGEGIVGLDPEGNLSFENAAALRLLDWDAGRMLGRSFHGLAHHHHADGRPYPAADCPVQKTLEDGRLRHVEDEVFFRRDGSSFPVAYTCAAVRDAGGALAGAVVSFQDTTARRAAEARIRHLARLYETLSQVNQVIVRARDRDALFAEVCRVVVRFGEFAAAWIGRLEPGQDTVRILTACGAGSDRIPPAGPRLDGGDCPVLARAVTSGQLAVGEGQPGPAAPWLSWMAESGFRACAAVPSADGTGTLILALYQFDTTAFRDPEVLTLLAELGGDLAYAVGRLDLEDQRERARAALEHQQLITGTILQSLPGIFYLFDDSGRFLRWNQNFERASGRSGDEIARLQPLDFIAPEDRDLIAQRIQAAFESGSAVAEARFLAADGTTTLHFFTGERVFLDGRAHLCGVGLDISAQRRTEGALSASQEQLRQSQKMEAIGLLAGGVAHDFNNILSAVLLQVDLSLEVPGLPHEARDGLLQVRAAAERAASLTNQLLAFGRRQVLQPLDLDLNQAVTGFARMLRRIIGEDIQLDLDLHPQPLAVRADPGMLDQVLLNLAVNARDAMPAGGRLRVATHPGLPRPDPRAAGGPRHWVWFEVEDTGCGIPAEVLPRIFDPFFTTKEQGRGTGLGLSTVFGVVQQHGGWIDVESETARGTRFLIVLPALDQPLALAAPHEPAPRPAGGQETILLVEDEPSVAMVARLVLERVGYRVHQADSGTQALERWPALRGTVDLLVTDLTMPGGVGGLELAACLRADRPDLPVLYISGYRGSLGGLESELKPGENFLQKPFAAEALLDLVRRCLHR